MRFAVYAGIALLSCATTAFSQACGGNFWSNDNLPQTPGPNPTSISLVPGLCEGEAAAQVFTLGPTDPPQLIDTVSVGFADQFGSGTLTATANIEIYDGVTFSGGIPTLGPKIFDLNDDTGSSVQLTSGGINTFDLSSESIVVGGSASNFVVAWRMNINPNGNCASGYSAAFFTDNTGFGGCNTTPQTSLIDIQGQGWRDASTATVGGFPLCPIFFNGNWVIRACTDDAGSVTCQPNLGLQGPGNVSLEVCGGDLSTGTTADFSLTNAPGFAPTTVLVSLQLNPQFVPKVFGTLGPLPATFVINVATDGTGSLVIPDAVPGGSGPVSIYMQAVVVDGAQINGFAVSNTVQLDFLP